MHERFNKYFWDGGYEECSESYRLRRIIEYASFPDLIHYPFELFREYVGTLNLDRLWTGKSRIEFVKLVARYRERADTWEGAVMTALADAAREAKRETEEMEKGNADGTAATESG